VLLGMEYHGLHGATWQGRIDWEYTLKVHKFGRRQRQAIRTQERICSASHFYQTRRYSYKM
jgi:hypothetical protein